MKSKVNISKIAIMAVFGVCALFNQAFAFKPIWFEAEFEEFHDSGYWFTCWVVSPMGLLTDDPEESYFYDSKLYLEGEKATLQLDSGRSAERYNLFLTINSTIECDGFDELPAPPLKSAGYKVAVAPMYGDSYYVLGYDEEGKTNRWFDSGIATISDRPVEFTVCLAYTNCENIAVYEFDGKRSEPVKIWDSDISACEFIGCGAVSRCIGYDEEAVPMIPLELPQIDGLRSRIDRKKNYGYPEEYITVYFDTDTMIPSRTSARFWVAPDGRLVFEDEGEFPYAIDIVATRNGVPYASFEEALAGADNYDYIRLERDVQFFHDLELNHVILDLNGHYLDPDSSGRSTLTINKAFVYDYFDYTWCGAIHATINLNVSMDMSWQDVYFFEVNFCKPDIVLIMNYPIAYYYSAVSGYEVVMEETDDGRFRYSMVRVPTVGSVLDAKTDDRAKLLGCSPDAVEEELAKFKIESIRFESGKWTVTVTGGKRHGDRYGNGYVRIYKVDAGGNPTDDPNACMFRAAIVPNPPSD